MKVRAITGFVSTIDGKKFRVQAGAELPMPAGADWLQAGLVVAADGAEDDPAQASLPFTTRVSEILAGNGYTTADAVAAASDEELLALDGIGQATLATIREELDGS